MIADVFIWDRKNHYPMSGLYPNMKQAMSGYTGGIIQCKPEYNISRSGYAHLNYIAFTIFIFQQNQCEIILMQHIIFHTNEGVRTTRGLSHIFQIFFFFLMCYTLMFMI